MALAMLNVGDTVRDCRIVARLRAGGMATLYLGRKQGAAGFSRPVAIKVMHPELTEDPVLVRMFVEEALLAAQVHHPNVVHVEEFGEVSGAYFLAMEYVPGVSLAQLFRGLARRGRRLSPALAVYIASEVASGLHAAHEAVGADGAALRIVHRDVSPQNVLLAPSGHAKLIDFGIAKALGRAARTATGFARGKLGYMAPEQAHGRAVDRRTDVYALGIVLWELLTMQRLFEADDDFVLLDRVRDPRVEPPSRVAPGIPPALDAAVLAALAPEIDARPDSARAFRRLLAEALPAASAIDPADVARVLREVVGDELDSAARLLVEDGATPSARERERERARGDGHGDAATAVFADEPATLVDPPSFLAPIAQAEARGRRLAGWGVAVGAALAVLGAAYSYRAASHAGASPRPTAAAAHAPAVRETASEPTPPAASEARPPATARVEPDAAIAVDAATEPAAPSAPDAPAPASAPHAASRGAPASTRHRGSGGDGRATHSTRRSAIRVSDAGILQDLGP